MLLTNSPARVYMTSLANCHERIYLPKGSVRTSSDSSPPALTYLTETLRRKVLALFETTLSAIARQDILYCLESMVYGLARYSLFSPAVALYTVCSAYAV
ncbi:unknown [Anaerotruncus sp. CAG:390]|nr:unknown [Anaerotruncus sp. CAG:390]